MRPIRRQPNPIQSDEEVFPLSRLQTNLISLTPGLDPPDFLGNDVSFNILEK